MIERTHETSALRAAREALVSSQERVARRLDEFNRARFAPGDARASVAPSDCIVQELDFVEDELANVRARAAEAPSDAGAFLEWFTELRRSGPGQWDPLFDWLATECSKEAMVWFLRQEVAGEAGFEDLVALTQLKMPRRAKLELARNYWDEMGQGQASAMHGPMLAHLAEELGIVGTPGEVVWESLALANLMVAFAVHRRHTFRSVGALGVIELTAPDRAKRINEGLKRLGMTGEARRYYALHATLDIKHSATWNAEVIRPLVEDDPACALPIAEGALARLAAGARCFERYRSALCPR